MSRSEEHKDSDVTRAANTEPVLEFLETSIDRPTSSGHLSRDSDASEMLRALTDSPDFMHDISKLSRLWFSEMSPHQR